ncbi:PEP/pyruvate-binding domain-containing protein [Vibrio sp. M60_M31a]
MQFNKSGNVTQPTITLPTSSQERSQLVLSDDEILQLSKWAVIIERHYGCPMDMEWAKDTLTQQLYMVQARPETVESHRDAALLVNYKLEKPPHQCCLKAPVSVVQSQSAKPTQCCLLMISTHFQRVPFW